MLYLLLIIEFVSSFTPDRLPATNPPPDARAFALMDNFPSLNLIMVYGGYSDPTNSIYGDIWTFNISAETWERLIPSDGISPTGRYSGGSFGLLSQDLYCIFGGMSLTGPINDLWCFQTKGFLWNQITTSGDAPTPRMRFGYTSFYDKNNVLQFVVFGGVTISGVDSNLYILNTSTWVWSAIEVEGDTPLNSEEPSLVYYNKKLYTAGGGNTYAKISHNEALLYFDLESSDKKWHNITSSNTYTYRIFNGSFLKGSELYLMMGYSTDSKSHESSWYKVDLEDPDYDWKTVSISEDINRNLEIDSYGWTLIENTLYIFGGDKNPPLINQLAILDISVSPITFSVFENYLSPTSRMYHSLQPIGPNLYLFGGLGDNGNIYNDFWAFNVMKEEWSLINSQGQVPSKRYGYASAVNADIMLVWGGYSQEGYLNDGYIYDITSEKWYAISYTGTAPSPRVGACADFIGWFIYIYGGLTEGGLSDELWAYDVTTETYSLITSKSGPGALYFSTCSADIHKVLWVLYGESDDDTPTNKIYGFDTGKSSWIKYNDDTSDTTYSRSRAAVFKTTEQFLIVGGESWGLYPNTELFYFTTEASQFTLLGNLDDVFFAPGYTYFQNDFYIHGGGTSATTLLRFSVPDNKFLKLSKHLFCPENSPCNFTCSYGTYKTASNCEICPQGTYSDKFNLYECKKCPSGKYGPHYGATSLDMCYPCSENFYNDKEGQERCINCPATSICKVGSKAYTSYIRNFEDSSVQPQIYSANQDEINQNTLIIQIVVGITGLLVVIYMIISKKSKEILQSFDLYIDKHNHFINEPMYLKNTSVGGLFGIIFIFLAMIIIGTELVSFASNNIYEIKSLIPLVVLEQDIPKFEADFIISITLMNYGSSCVSTGNVCSAYIFSNIDGITGNWEELSCEQKDNGDCMVYTKCHKCTINKQGLLKIIMEDPNGYTSGYSVNVTSSSSIPNKYSSYNHTILSDTNFVFSGSDPTVIYFDIIPSYYKDTQESGNYTGYHVSLDKASHKGSQFEPYVLGLTFINYLTIEFDVDNNGLATTRYYNQTWIILLTTLLSSIFGVKGAIGGLMKFIEKKIILLHKKKKHIDMLKALEKNSKFIEKLREHSDFKVTKDLDSPNIKRTEEGETEKEKLSRKEAA
ncbi:unnamed protein product [Blepharisma stoltei]|uniref:Tyrosine-protein kinase ephrin type A/B receptor-like domain-containing protein n=1 Tax=Blepharisma stoltei TaxID=1481888 RepID=A0AAU9IZ92_9CILI|nr:unnamed protein product [Blepharisma stoltei]